MRERPCGDRETTRVPTSTRKDAHIDDQHDRVETLEAENDGLRERNAEFEARLDRIEAELGIGGADASGESRMTETDHSCPPSTPRSNGRLDAGEGRPSPAIYSEALAQSSETA